MSIKAKSLLLSFIVLGLFTVVSTTGLVLYQEHSLSYIRSDQNLLLDNEHKVMLEMVDGQMMTHLMTISRSEKVVDSIQELDRDALYKHMKPIYESLQKLMKDSIGVYHFYLSDGTSFLRMHRYEHHGDNTLDSRPLLRETIETSEVTTGYESGRFGLFYRIEYPLFIGSRLLGVIDIGIDLNALKIPLALVYPVKAMTLIPYEVYKDSPNAPFVRDFDGEHVVEGDERALQVLRDIGSDSITEGSIIHHLEETYLVHIIEIRDERDALLAKRLYLGDISQEYDGKQVALQSYVIMSLLMLMLLAYILHKNFNVLIADLLRSEEKYKALAGSLEEEVRSQTAYILQQSRLAQMGEMISMLAHQWRQPLSSISAVTGTLRLDVMMDDYSKAFFAERLEKIEMLSQHLSATIDDFRKFFKKEKTLEETTAKRLIEESLGIIVPTLIDKAIETKVEIESQRGILTYPSEVRHAILSILKNAEEALSMKEVKDARISIRGYEEGEEVHISIEDNAGGISEENMDRVFDPYYSTKRQKDGTGLGLYMAKRIIEEHCDGSLTLVNTPYGALFTIRLPILQKENTYERVDGSRDVQ